MTQLITWTIVDHLCRACGGRILKSKTGAGMTPGGNPIYKCADCGVQAFSNAPNALCWCGMTHKHNRKSPYRCLPFSILGDQPEIENLFRSCGCDPDKGEVGIVLVDGLQNLRAKNDT